MKLLTQLLSTYHETAIPGRGLELYRVRREAGRVGSNGVQSGGVVGWGESGCRVYLTDRHVFLLAEEAHSDVVPQGGALRRRLRRHAVLAQRDVEVPVLLHHAARRYDRLHVTGVVGHRVAELLKRLLVLADLRRRRHLVSSASWETWRTEMKRERD